MVKQISPMLCLLKRLEVRKFGEKQCFDQNVLLFADKDPSHQFMRKNNRELLHSLTCMQIDKVFRFRPMPFKRETYQFLTADELKQKFEGALRAARRLLLMPPIIPYEEDNIEVISKDPELQGLDDSKYLFIDTTFGLKDRERMALVRHPNGVLETTDQITRRRMIQAYFPFPERRIIVPRMFFGEHLQRVLDEKKYEFVLNRAIVQFEPYEKDYHRVTSITYQHINENDEFDIIRSTRHFGPMSFFLAWHKLIDNLVIDCIRRDYLRNAIEAICLMYNLNELPYDAYILEQLKQYPKRDDEYYYRQLIDSKSVTETHLQFELEQSVGKTAEELKVDEICLEFLSEYCQSANANKKNEIKAAIQTYKEQAEEKKRLLEGLQKAHGIN